MTLQELNEQIRKIIDENGLKNSCGFYIYDNDTVKPTHRHYGGVPYDWFGGVYKDQYDTTVFRLIGGLNGPNLWENYLSGLTTLITKLNQLPEVDHRYIIELENDCIDDVFDAIIGISPASGIKFEE